MIRHVVMLLSNAFRPDPRVLKEAIVVVYDRVKGDCHLLG